MGHIQQVVVLPSFILVRPLGFVVAIERSLSVVVVVVVIVHFVVVIILIILMPLHLIQKKLNHLHFVVLVILPIKHHSRMKHRLTVAYL